LECPRWVGSSRLLATQKLAFTRRANVLNLELR
jgi:hypothetical protein